MRTVSVAIPFAWAAFIQIVFEHSISCKSLTRMYHFHKNSTVVPSTMRVHDVFNIAIMTAGIFPAISPVHVCLEFPVLKIRCTCGGRELITKDVSNRHALDACVCAMLQRYVCVCVGQSPQCTQVQACARQHTHVWPCVALVLDWNFLTLRACARCLEIPKRCYAMVRNRNKCSAACAVRDILQVEVKTNRQSSATVYGAHTVCV